MSVGKIILKSTTRMSLNDRFTVLRQEKPSNQGQSNVGLEDRRQQAQASRRNQRLAAQMERRPAVVAALKLKKQRPMQRIETQVQRRADLQHQKTNIRQRLAVKGRLSLPNDNIRRISNIRGRGGMRGLRGATGSYRGMGARGIGLRGGRGSFGNKGGGYIVRAGGNMLRGMRGGARGGRGGGRFMTNRGGMQGRGGRGGVRGNVGGQFRGGLRRMRGQGRGGRISRGNRRGRGAGRMQNGNFTREQLDQQLDDYMSKSNEDEEMTDLIM